MENIYLYQDYLVNIKVDASNRFEVLGKKLDDTYEFNIIYNIMFKINKNNSI